MVSIPHDPAYSRNSDSFMHAGHTGFMVSAELTANRAAGNITDSRAISRVDMRFHIRILYNGPYSRPHINVPWTQDQDRHAITAKLPKPFVLNSTSLS